MAGLDPATEESARSLGRGPVRTFFTVTVPLLRPAIAAGGAYYMHLASCTACI